MKSTPFALDTPHGSRLRGVVQVPEASGPKPTVVVCHGFKGFMEWGFFPSLAELLCGRGFTVVRFNFSGSGMQPGDELVTAPEAFRRATFSKDVADLEALLAAAGTEIAPDQIDRGRLGLLGHSRGGGTAILAAASAPSIKALVTWSAVSTFDRMGEVATAQWRQDGFLPIVNARTGQSLEMGIEVLDDLDANREALDIQRAAADRTAPWLIVHGGDDETVPASEARDLAGRARDPLELLVIEGGSHTFGAVHPFAGPTAELIQALNATQTWFRRHV